MTDRPNLLRYWRRAVVVRRDDGERSATRLVGTVIVVGGLAFSASLNPLPGTWPILEFRSPGAAMSSALPNLVESIAANKIIDLRNVELPALVHLAEVLHDSFPAASADVVLTAVERYGLPDVIRSLEVLASSGSVVRDYAVALGGGGGGGGGTAQPSQPIMLPDLALLLQMLMQSLPTYLVQGLSDVIAALFPALVGGGPSPDMAIATTSISPATIAAQLPVSVPSLALPEVSTTVTILTPAAAPPPAEPTAALVEPVPTSAPLPPPTAEFLAPMTTAPPEPLGVEIGTALPEPSGTPTNDPESTSVQNDPGAGEPDPDPNTGPGEDYSHDNGQGSEGAEGTGSVSGGDQSSGDGSSATSASHGSGNETSSEGSDAGSGEGPDGGSPSGE